MDEIDLKIIEYFFTNVDKKVFFARNLHPEVWAIFQARYIRSVEGVREGFINLLKKRQRNMKTLGKCLVKIKHQTLKWNML